jgi:hypothetical protein
MCPTPARVAQWLTEHGQLRPKWLPIQAVHALWNSCAFVVLSGNVMHDGTWQKWRDAGKPEDWKIMTKVEHTKRTAEYLALLEQENPRGMRKITQDTDQLPPIARSAALSMAFEPLPEDADTQVEPKKKRKRRKPTKFSDQPLPSGDKTGDLANQEEIGMSDAGEVQPKAAESTANKKKRKRRKSGKPGPDVEMDNASARIEADTAPPKKRRV